MTTYSEPDEAREEENNSVLPPHLSRDKNLYLENDDDADRLAKMINERRKPTKMRLKDWSKDQDLPGGPPPTKIPKALEKKASADDYGNASADEYAYVDRGGRPHYPIRTPELVKKAVSWFAQHYNALPLPTRRGIAEKIASKARAFGIADVLPSLDLTVMGKYAGTHYNPDFSTHLASRMRLTSDPEVVQVLQVLQERCEALPATKVAEALHNLDRHAGFGAFYDQHFPDAFASTLAWAAKIATIGNDTDITEADVKQLLGRPEIWRKYFDESTMKHMAQDPGTVYGGLPAPHKAALQDLVDHMRGSSAPSGR